MKGALNVVDSCYFLPVAPCPSAQLCATMMMINIAHSFDDIAGPKSSKVAAGLFEHDEALPAPSVARKIGKSAADVADRKFHEFQCDLHEAREMQEAQLQSAADAKARARVADKKGGYNDC
jgi:hypothetical protein